jgi:hypothetical protein
MNIEDIIRMAREAGLAYGSDEKPLNSVTRFAALVAAAEREACAKVCDEKVDAEYKTGKVDHHEMGWTQACAIAIRGRSEQ